MTEDQFEIECSMLEVTSLNRPDESWRYVDAAGHEHRWHVDGQPITSYNPQAKHETPTLVWIKDGEEFWEDDDEPHDVGHLECRICGEHVAPRYKPDDCAQYIPGLKRYRINGESVTRDEYIRRRGYDG